MHSFDLYLLLQQHEELLVNATDKEAHIFYTDPTWAWVSCAAPQEQFCFNAPCLFHNHFMDSIISLGVEAAIIVTVAPNHSHVTSIEMCNIYRLADFIIKLCEYIQCCIGSNNVQQILQIFNKVRVWYKFHI